MYSMGEGVSLPCQNEVHWRMEAARHRVSV